VRRAAPWFALLITLCAARAGAGVPLTPEIAARLDPRLLQSALIPGPDPVPVWVSLADKGEREPSDLAIALARAEAALTPRCRARRERCGVTPLVDYRDLPLHAPYLDALAARGLRPYGQSRWFNRVAVRVPGARLGEVAALPFVRRVSPVERAFLRRELPEGEEFQLPVHPESGRAPLPEGCILSNSINYGLNAAAVGQINVPAVHDSGYIGTGVLVCILDEGFNYHNKQEALAPVVIAPGFERDFVDGDFTATDTLSTCCSHGTWVMGCLAGNKPGSYVGTAPGAQYALGRTEVHATEKPIEMVYWGMGAEWADSIGADLISSSLGYNQFPDSAGTDYTFADMDGHTTIVSQAAEIAASKGILVVNAAGNEGGSTWQKIIAPADVNGDSLIAVGAVDASGNLASFSSRGPTADGRIKPDLCARGVSNALVSAGGNPQGYTTLSGTSFATPLLAGLAACLVQARPTWPATLVIRALRETGSKATSPDTLKGYGIANGLAALRWTYAGVSVPAPAPGQLGLRLTGPNPLRASGPALTVRFVLGAGIAGTRARLAVYDAQGRRVRSLYNGPICAEQWLTATWDGAGDDGMPLGAGVYFLGMEAAGRHTSARVVWLR